MSDPGGTPEYVQIPENLKSRFSELDGISGLIIGLAGRIEQIHTLNRTAAGEDDAVAKAYHAQIGQPTQDMTTLVQEIGAIFAVRADDGSAAAEVLDRSGDYAAEVAATDWETTE